MAAAPYIFPAQQAEFLRALRDGRYRAPVRTRNVPSAKSLVSKMPPIYEQALRGTCVANAVTAMLEYYEDCKMRLSVQYLFAATKEVERAGLERNFLHLRTGEPLDPAFEHVHHSKLLQLRMMADANGGINAPVMKPYLAQFEETVRTRYESMEGSLLRSCFNVLEFRGTCRYALWPYAGVSAAPLFGPGDRIAYPPGSDEDAKKHRVLSGLYLLPAPNNVDEIRGILAGVNGRRPMPVCVTVSFFAGCDGETFTFPRTEETEAGLVAKDEWLGVHGMLIVGYVDSAAAPGGGYFLVRNSLGEAWGNRGYGKLPYAYVACFALEAGTILQDFVDYTGDGYGGLHMVTSEEPPRRHRHRGLWLFIVNLLIAGALVAGTWAVVKWYQDQKPPVPPGPPVPSAPSHPPYAEVTVYGRDSKVNVTLPPPWDEVSGVAIDGGMVFRLPAKTRAEVDAIRRRLDAEPTLREKRGKPLTFDIVAFYNLVSDDLADVRKTIGMFAADRFLVRIEGESNGVLRVSTISPRGFEQRLKQEYAVKADGGGRLVLKPKVDVVGKPEKPEKQEKPEKPEVPEIPEVPEVPENPEKMGEPGKQEKPGKPEVPEVPENPEKMGEPDKPNPPVVSVTDKPNPPVVSVTDMPNPPVVFVTDDSEQVVIVGTNGVITTFSKAGTPKPAKSDDSAQVSNSSPAKVEGGTPIIRTGGMSNGRTDF